MGPRQEPWPFTGLGSQKSDGCFLEPMSAAPLLPSPAEVCGVMVPELAPKIKNKR